MARRRPFRIVSIENPAEVHARDGQLIVIQDKGTASIPIPDIMVLVVCGPSIRMSTMAQTMLAERKVVTLFLGRNHHPAAMLLPTVGCVRQARVAQVQAGLSPDLKARLWQAIIRQKIENQGRALGILGLDGAEQLYQCAEAVLSNDADNREGHAAKLYFQYLEPGLHRREEHPLNSALNYGYGAVEARGKSPSGQGQAGGADDGKRLCVDAD
jgi:CRISPR-associated protein Cas1